MNDNYLIKSLHAEIPLLYVNCCFKSVVFFYKIVILNLALYKQCFMQPLHPFKACQALLDDMTLLLHRS